MPSRSSRPRRTALSAMSVAAACLAAAGCSSEGGGDWINMYKIARNYWNGSNEHVSLERAASIPYATLGVRIGDGPEQILILASDSDEQQLWTASGRLALTTRYGRIVATSGLGTDLANRTNDRASEDWTVAHHFTWTADIPSLNVFSVPVACTDQPAGPDPIEILGKRFETTRIEEQCSAETLGWSFVNTYWVNPLSGIVWRSIQHVSPQAPVLELEILRPPASFG